MFARNPVDDAFASFYNIFIGTIQDWQVRQYVTCEQGRFPARRRLSLASLTAESENPPASPVRARPRPIRPCLDATSDRSFGTSTINCSSEECVRSGYSSACSVVASAKTISITSSFYCRLNSNRKTRTEKPNRSIVRFFPQTLRTLLSFHRHHERATDIDSFVRYPAVTRVYFTSLTDRF